MAETEAEQEQIGQLRERLLAELQAIREIIEAKARSITDSLERQFDEAKTLGKKQQTLAMVAETREYFARVAEEKDSMIGFMSAPRPLMNSEP